MASVIPAIIKNDRFIAFKRHAGAVLETRGVRIVLETRGARIVLD